MATNMNLLIPYIPIANHVDPDFREFTYGNNGSGARKLIRDLSAGDYVFFHTTSNGKKYITAYYVVDRVLETTKASLDKAITAKYKNPHITECIEGIRPVAGDDDSVLFGDPIRSKALSRPLPFDKKLSAKLSLKIGFRNDQSEAQAIGSATRAWRQLTDNDVDILLKQIKIIEEEKHEKLHRTTEEVSQVLEKDIEDHLEYCPSLIAKGLKLVGRQLTVPSGRIDLLFENSEGALVVVEVKLGRIGRDALNQVKRYISDLKEVGEKASGVIVCEGVLPAYEELLQKQKNVRVMIYGWNLSVQPWP